MKFNQPMIKKCTKTCQGEQKCQENIKICNIIGELLSNGVLPRKWNILTINCVWVVSCITHVNETFPIIGCVWILVYYIF